MGRCAGCSALSSSSTSRGRSRAGGTSTSACSPAAGIVLYLAWNTGTAVGVLGGGALGDPRRIGLDAAFPALFLALLVPQVRTRRAQMVALVGGLIALTLIPFVPARPCWRP